MGTQNLQTGCPSQDVSCPCGSTAVPKHQPNPSSAPRATLSRSRWSISRFSVRTQHPALGARRYLSVCSHTLPSTQHASGFSQCHCPQLGFRAKPWLPLHKPEACPLLLDSRWAQPVVILKGYEGREKGLRGKKGREQAPYMSSAYF